MDVKLINFILCIVFISFGKSDNVFVTTNNGQIMGRTATTASGLTYYSFQGIPFAEPPINELRFKAPITKTPWNNIIDATYERGCCYQMSSDRPEETEDCLYLNVYTPKDPSLNGTIPVMFFIYGGGFIEGYSEFVNYGPQHLMEHDVILITINYRVGPFGFFTTGDDIIPGNNGLKDQLLALKWTNKNIMFFGGDPDKVTIFGQSAGAASVVHHVLSPKSAGLFRAAISQSGSALSPWSYQRDTKNISYQLAVLLDSKFADYQANSSELYQFLSSVSAKDIDRASHEIYSWESPLYNQMQQGFFFTPIIEHEHDDAFLTKSMYDCLDRGEINNVPLMIGVNTEECLIYDADPDLWVKYTEYFDANPSLLIPYDLNILSAEDRNSVASMIKKFYSATQNFTAVPRNLIKYFSDQAFTRSIIKHAEMQSKYGELYFYQFAFHGVLGAHTEESVLGFSEDVRHGEEMSFVMTRNWENYNTSDLTKYPKVDQLVQKRMITLFTNFAKYLNPTPEMTVLFQNLIWPKVESDNFQYLDIGSDLDVRRNPKNKIFMFWEEIYSKYGVPPYITY